MIYTVESLRTIKEEIAPLFKEAWDEVDQLAEHMPLDPDWEKAYLLEDSGMWRTYTQRTEDSGELVGFICMIIQSVLHSKGNYHAVTDVAYVKPKHRGGFVTLLNLAEEDLKEEGVKWITFTLKAWDKRGGFLEKLGYNLFENIYQKAVN
jgi:hypothetical protein